MKLAKSLWSLGSILVNITIGFYIYLMSQTPTDPVEKLAFINQNWASFGAHWKLEFLFMAMIAIGAVYFATNLKKVSWSIISVGQLIILLTYPIMLGGYKNTPLEIFQMANEMATVVFLFGNLIFFAGLLHLYGTETRLKTWLKYAVLAMIILITIAFGLAYGEVITWKQALITGPLANLMYLFNAWYGWKMLS